MTREIKFRGRNAKGEWLVGDLIHNRGETFIAPEGIANPLATAEDFRVDPDTVGQYWFGKGESELYTGDVLAVCSDCFSDIQGALDNEAGVCVSAIGPFGEIEVPEEDYDQTHVCWLDDNAKHYEKLGNIHDNPELLNKE